MAQNIHSGGEKSPEDGLYLVRQNIWSWWLTQIVSKDSILSQELQVERKWKMTWERTVAKYLETPEYISTLKIPNLGAKKYPRTILNPKKKSHYVLMDPEGLL